VTRTLPYAGPAAVARRLTGLIPPAAGIPVYGMGLVPPGRTMGTSANAVLTPAGLDAALAEYAAGWGDPDPRAAATQFSKYWFRAAIPPVLVCAAADRAAPAIELPALGAEMDGGIPYLLARDAPGIAVAPADGESLMARLVDEHLVPVIAALATHTGLSPRVFWANAGTVIAWYLDQLRRQPATAAGARALAARWLETPDHPAFSGRNPMHNPLIATTDAAGHAKQQRRVCCVRYLSSDLDLCASCPLSKAPAARRAKR